ncbi:MAG TPA: hypothetical protein PK297_09530, partial [Spirochaetota bacterium]|nr:hypothetical protein [Spirochaetota bacterium]
MKGMLMTVSELSKKYNMQATDVDKYVQRAGAQNLAVTDPIPADTLASVERMIQTDGHKPAHKQAMLIKKTKQAEDAAVAQVRKKIVIKKRPSAGGHEGEQGSSSGDEEQAADSGARPSGLPETAQLVADFTTPAPESASPVERPIQQEQRPQGDRPGYGSRPQGDRPGYGSRPQGQGDRPGYGSRPQGDRPGYGSRPQ